MPEHDCLPPDLAAAEFVTHMARISGLPKTAARERASEALRHVGLYEERYRQIGGYSTGMKQRVKLAQALVHDPDLLLLDEPTNGLDPAGRDAMLALIHRIGTEFGISVVVCSHLLGEVERICDSLVAIDGGRLLRADRISAMTEARDVLVVEVSEGTDELVTRLSGLGLPVARDGRAVLVPLDDDATYDTDPRRGRRPRPAAAPLDQRRHRVAELFATATSERRPSMSTETTAAGVIHDIGYQRYTGPRLGRAYACRSLYVHGVRTAFGLGRSAKAKIFPWIVVGIVGMVAVVLTAVRAQTGEVPLSYWGFPEAMAILVILFCAVVGARAGLPGPARRGAAAVLLPAADPVRLRAGQVRRPGHGDVPAAGRAAVAHVPRRRVHRCRSGRTPGTSSSTSPRVCRRRRVYALIFAALAILVASLAGRRAVAAAMVVALFLVTTPSSACSSASPTAARPTECSPATPWRPSQLAGLVSPMTLVSGVGPVVVPADRADRAVRPALRRPAGSDLRRRDPRPDRAERPAPAPALPEGGPMTTGLAQDVAPWPRRPRRPSS